MRPAGDRAAHTRQRTLSVGERSPRRPSADGRYVAFTNDVFGPGLVYRLDTQTGMTDTLSTKGNVAVSMSDGGSRVVFDATFGTIGALDLIATFLYDYGVPPAERPRRIAGGEQASLAIAPAISGDGNRLAFFSFFTTDLGGGFAHFIQMLDLTTEQTPLVTPPYKERMFEALTPFASRYLSFNRDGSRLAFATPSDLTGSNGDGNFEIFVYEYPGNVLLQTTRSDGGDIPLASGDLLPGQLRCVGECGRHAHRLPLQPRLHRRELRRRLRGLPVRSRHRALLPAHQHAGRRRRHRAARRAHPGAAGDPRAGDRRQRQPRRLHVALRSLRHQPGSQLGDLRLGRHRHPAGQSGDVLDRQPQRPLRRPDQRASGAQRRRHAGVLQLQRQPHRHQPRRARGDLPRHPLPRRRRLRRRHRRRRRAVRRRPAKRRRGAQRLPHRLLAGALRRRRRRR